jgi:hypothetical protein
LLTKLALKPIEGPEKAPRGGGGVNGSQSKFLTGTCLYPNINLMPLSSSSANTV